MTPEHAFLQSMLEVPNDLGQPLIFADWLEEHGNGLMAELLRLIVAESNSARHSPPRNKRMSELRDQAFQGMYATDWYKMRGRNNDSGVSFYRSHRSLHSGIPGWEYIAICFTRRLVRCARVSRDGDECFLMTVSGQILQRRSPESNRGASLVDPIWAGRTPGFNLFGKEKHLDRTSIPLADLPVELVMPVAYLLCQYQCDKERRVRAGQVVPGAHFFAFCAGETRWRHARVLENREADQVESLLRERFRSRSLFGAPSPRSATPLAGLLVRVSDQGNITADKLIWVRGHLVKETSDLPPRADATLPEGSFRDALVDLKLNAVAAEAFVVATPERLRELFRSSDS